MKLFVHQVRSEQLLFWRSREAALFVFLLPVLLFLLLGAVYSGEVDGHPAADYLLVGMLGYGVANTAFGGLAITLVLRREYGILKRLRSTPLPAATYLAAVLVSTLMVFAIQSALIIAIGRALFGAELPDRVPSLLLTMLLGAAVFAAIGLGVTALVRSAEGSSPIVNIVILPMAFLSGSFGPPDRYPDFLQAIADVLPLTYFIELVGSVYLEENSAWSRPGAIGVMALWGVGGLVMAIRRFGWEPRER